MVWYADYEAWGNTATVEWKSQRIDNIVVSEEHLQPIRFQGQSFDVETGLHYNRFRYFDPDLGMFTTRDPIGLLGGNNVFQYAPNPTGWIDPFGLSGEDVTTYYHAGGDLSSSSINPGSGRPNLEFNPTGQGAFYVTNDRAQAERWLDPSRGRVEITEFNVPNSELERLDHRQFTSGDTEWEDFSRQGRQGTLSHSHDLVSGPMVANPRAVRTGGRLKPIGQQMAVVTKAAAALFDKCKKV